MFATVLCGLRFRDVGNAFCISSCCGIILSCSGVVGNVVLVRCWHSRVEGHACLHIFVWVRCCHSLTVRHVCLHIFVVVVAGILVNTVSASDSRSEGWGIESPCPYISDVRIR